MIKTDSFINDALYSIEAMRLKAYEFAILMRDFSNLANERRGLDFDVLNCIPFFKDSYY